MCKKYSINISSFFVVVFFTIGLWSCGNVATEANADHIKLPNQDSINAILKDIHAEEKTKQLDALYQNKAKHGFNGCVLIAQRGQILYKEAFGYSNIRIKEPLKINTSFQLASASKPFTAAAILLLMEQNKLNLTDKVSQYIPNFPYPEITIHTLLTHRSGLSNYVYFGELFCTEDGCYKGAPYDNDAVIEIINASKPVPYCPPNKKFGYCNTNYVLLASIVEKVSGLSFADFMRENIFVPLKMNNTWVRTPNGYLQHKNVALGHKATGRIECNDYADDVVGDKGVYSTVEDLFKWDQALYTDRILKQETLEKAFTGYSNEHKGKRNYGLGWRITDHGNGKKDIYHNGWWHGYNTTLFRRPANEITIIVLSNKDNKNAYMINDILAIINSNFSPETKEKI
jgi:CubicO group peptidase (beta-lactamase class C family)